MVGGEQAEAFLQEKLALLGLAGREVQDFMEYWLPELQENAYNLISFSTSQYEQLTPLEIMPAPDSILRVHMAFKSLEQPVQVQEQILPQFERKEFCVVEWGGTRA